jgi:hypothetical protein
LLLVVLLRNYADEVARKGHFARPWDSQPVNSTAPVQLLINFSFALEFMQADGGFVISNHPFRLDTPGATFFGVEEGIFKHITGVARAGRPAAANIRQLQEFPFIFSGLSVLRDGSAIGPAEFFRVIGPETY